MISPQLTLPVRDWLPYGSSQTLRTVCSHAPVLLRVARVSVLSRIQQREEETVYKRVCMCVCVCVSICVCFSVVFSSNPE